MNQTQRDISIVPDDPAQVQVFYDPSDASTHHVLEGSSFPGSGPLGIKVPYADESKPCELYLHAGRLASWTLVAVVEPAYGVAWFYDIDAECSALVLYYKKSWADHFKKEHGDES